MSCIKKLSIGDDTPTLPHTMENPFFGARQSPRAAEVVLHTSWFLSQLLVFNTSFSQVEISKGYGSSSEDFHLAATVDALDGYHSAAAASYLRSPGGAPPKVLRAMLAGLNPDSEYNVRVTAISRYDVIPSLRKSENTGLVRKREEQEYGGLFVCIAVGRFSLKFVGLWGHGV